MPVNNKFAVESLPFSDVPNQTKLFIEYQKNPLSLSEYYPNAVHSHTEITEYIPKVLENYKADRDAVCDALEEMNRKFGAGEKTLENISFIWKIKKLQIIIHIVRNSYFFIYILSFNDFSFNE